MEPRLSFVTLGVADLQRATRFYEEYWAFHNETEIESDLILFPGK